MKKQLITLLYITAYTVSVFGMDVPEGTSRSHSSSFGSTAVAAAAATAMAPATTDLTSSTSSSAPL